MSDTLRSYFVSVEDYKDLICYGKCSYFNVVNKRIQQFGFQTDNKFEAAKIVTNSALKNTEEYIKSGLIRNINSGEPSNFCFQDKDFLSGSDEAQAIKKERAEAEKLNIMYDLEKLKSDYTQIVEQFD